MIIETREIYKCDHCRKVYQIKSACIKHEHKCKKNKANHIRCFDGCIYLVKKETEVTHFDYNGHDHQEKKSLLYCESKKIFLYPYWFNNPVLQEDIKDEVDNVQMPKECDKFNYFKIL